MGLAAILQLVNIAAPEIVNLIVSIKGASGNTLFVHLDSAAAGFSDNLTEVNAWLTAHGKTPVVVPATPPTPTV